MKRAGIKERARSTRGNTFIAVGDVIDYKRIGCPKCDTVYLQLYRNNREVLFMAMTEEEANIISNMLWNRGALIEL